MGSAVIPPITDPMGSSVAQRQPQPDEIEVDSLYAAMTRQTLAKLSEYSSSIPTGVYEGKMWKCKRGPDPDDWWLRWYENIYNGQAPVTHCAIETRQILIIGWIERVRQVPVPKYWSFRLARYA